MMKKRERQFQTIGVRMRDFGRGIMRHYVPQQQFPAQREAPPPNWQAEIETPLLWEESVLPAPEAAPPVDNITPPLPASEPTPPAAPKPVPAAPEKPIQRQSAPPQPPANAPKLPASLLKLAEEGRKRDVQREEIRQDKLAKFSEQLSNADPEAAAQIRRRRGKMSVNYVDTKPLSQGEEPPIQRQSEPVQPVPERDEAEPVEDVSATNAETAIETGDALLPADASSQASDTPVVDSLQRSASAADSPLLQTDDITALNEELQVDSSSSQAQDTPIVDSVERAPNEALPPLPAFLPPAETATTGTGYGSPVEVPPARDLSVQRDAAPLSMPTPAPVQPIPGERPTVPAITVPLPPAPTAAPSEPTVEARAAQPPVEHQASELAPSSPHLVPPSDPRSTETPPFPSLPTVPPVSIPGAVQRAVPVEVEPPTQSDIVLPTDPEPVQDDPAYPLGSNSPTVPLAPHSPTVSERSAPSTGAVSSTQPPLPIDTAAPATAPLSLQRDLPPEATISNQPAQIPAAPLSAASSRVSEVGPTDAPTSPVSEELVQSETLNRTDVSPALRPEANPAPQTSASTSALADLSEPAAISVQRTLLPNREVSVPITEPQAQPPAVSSTPTETPLQRETSREPSAAQVASIDKPATTPMVSAIEAPQSSPASNVAPLAQRESAETANQLESAPSEPASSTPPVPEALPSNEPTELPAFGAATSTPSPVQRELHASPPQTIPVETNLEAVIPAQPPVDQPAGLPAVSPTTSTPNPVQRVLDTAPFQTIPVETNLEAVIPVQPPIDQPSGTPAVNAATSTPSPVQRMLDAAPPQTSPVETNLEAGPPAQSPVDQPRLHALGSEVSVQPEPERFESPLETNSGLPLSDISPVAQPARAESSLGSGASIAQRELSAPLPTALETPALSPEKSASPDVPNPPIQRASAATEAQSTVEFNATTNEWSTASLPAEQASDIALVPVNPSPELPFGQPESGATEAQAAGEYSDFVNEAPTANLPTQPTSESATLPISHSPEASPVQREVFTAPDTSTAVTPPQISPPSAAPALEPPLETVTTTPLEAVAQRSVQVESEDQSDVDPAPPTAATAATPQRAVGQPPIVPAPIKEPTISAPTAVQPPQLTVNALNSQSAAQREAAPTDNSALPELTLLPAPTPSWTAATPEVSAAAPELERNTSAARTPPNELTVQRTPVTPTEAPTESVIEANSSESVGSTAPIPNVIESPQPAIGSPASIRTPINAVEPITTAGPTPDISPTETSIQREAQWAANAPAPSVNPTVMGTPPLSITEYEVAALPTGLEQPVVSLSSSDVPEPRAPQSSSPSLDPLVTASLPATAESVVPTLSAVQPDATVQRDPASPTASQPPSAVNPLLEPRSIPELSMTAEQPQSDSPPNRVPELSIPQVSETPEQFKAVAVDSPSNAQPVDVFAALQAAGMVARSVVNATTDSPPSADVSIPAWSGEEVEPEGDTGITNAPPSLPPVDVLTALQAMGLVPSTSPRADTRATAAIQRSPQPDSPTSAPVIQSEPLTPVLERVITAGDDCKLR
ncbi:MAG: hypothetical protein IPO91_02455 [Chloroflexi bacterium]|nr:hypothetical protein [Chloroflexota bacterium]